MNGINEKNKHHTNLRQLSNIVPLMRVCGYKCPAFEENTTLEQTMLLLLNATAFRQGTSAFKRHSAPFSSRSTNYNLI